MVYNIDMKKKLILISGLSGAGKTSVSNVLEDLGYVCIDQFPAPLLRELVELIEDDTTTKYEKVCITVPIIDLNKYFFIFDNLNIDAELILLDTDENVLLNRYKFTRRIHPLLVGNMADTLEEAIGIEKEILSRYQEKFTCINTTKYGTYELKNVVEALLNVDCEHKFTISFVSFGFKNGLPKDADLVFDVRFLENPFYYPELKHLTGNDEAVYNFVMSKDSTKEYVNYLVNYLDYSFNMYTKEGKRHLTVAVGCTGGQHRSASLVNFLYRNYKDKYNCLKKHRDIV